MTTGAPLYLVTACSSPEEFVAAFRRYTDRTGLFVPNATPLPAGKRGYIALTLVDGGVMLEGEAEVVSSSPRPSALHGRLGMTIRFVSPDEPSKILLGELERARIALRPVASSVTARPAELPAEPRPVPPPVGGRIDAANALAECVTVGDVGALRDGGAPTPTALPPLAATPRPASTTSPPLKAAPKFVLPAIPMKPPGTIPPPVGGPLAAPRAPEPVAAPPPRRPIDLAPPPPVLPDAAAPLAEEPAQIVAPVPREPELPTTRPAVRAPVSFKPPTATQPVAVVPPPARAAAGPARITQPPPLAAPSVASAPAPDDVDEKTDLTAVPDPPSARASAVMPAAAPPVDAPPRPATEDDVGDAIPTEAPAESRKTSLGIAAVLVRPAAPAARSAPTPDDDDDDDDDYDDDARAPDTAVMDAEPGVVVGPATVDAYAQTIQPGALDIDAIAAAAQISGDWVMTPDAEAPVPLAAPRPTAPPPGPPTGDWIIATGADSTDGWSAPAKVPPRRTPSPTGPPLAAVASTEPLSVVPHREPARLETGPTVQIDPTLIAGLVERDRPVSASGELDYGFPSSELAAPPLPPDALSMLAFAPTPMPTPYVPIPLGEGSPPPFAVPPPMPMPQPVAVAVATPAPILPPPPIAPAIDHLADAPLAPGDATAVVVAPRRRVGWIALVVAVLIAGGAFLVVTTGGSPRAAAPPPAPGSASAAPPALVSAPPAPTPAPTAPVDAGADASATAAPTPDASAPPEATTCTVKVVSVPAGAEVLVDEAVVGKTPTSLDLPCGVETKIGVRKAPLIGQVRAVTPKPGAASLVRVALAKATFQVKLSSSPAGAAITINGKSAGVTPSSTHLAAFEAATIVMTKAGYEPFTQSHTPRANGESVHATLKRKK